MATAREALASDAPLTERLERALLCMLDHTIEIEESPHGAEILDMKNSLAGDLVLSWRNRWFWSAPVATLLRPFDNFARQVGYYLGTMRPQFTQRYALLLSRDRRLRAQ